MNPKEKIKMFIRNSESVNSLCSLGTVYCFDILYDNELCQLFYSKLSELRKKEAIQWTSADLN